MAIKIIFIVILVAALSAFIFLGCQEETRELFEPAEDPLEQPYEEPALPPEYPMAPPPPEEQPIPPEGAFGPPLE